MAFNGSNPFKIPRPLALPGAWNAESLTGDKTLTLKDSIAQALDPGGGNKSVILPGGLVKGRFYVIANTGEEVLIICQPNGSAEVGRADQNDMAIVYASDDVAAGASSGWSLFFMVSGSPT